MTSRSNFLRKKYEGKKIDGILNNQNIILGVSFGLKRDTTNPLPIFFCVRVSTAKNPQNLLLFFSL